MAAPAPGGIRFGNYVLLRRIARGGMAEVFLAQQRGLEGFDRRVAVKRILPHLADAPDFVKMFLGEAKLAASLSHPNIVHIYDFGKNDGDYYIAMEFVDGVHAGDLFRIAEKEKLPPALVARIGADAATALHHAHELRGSDGKSLGLVHRDVSPANIMVSYDGVAKLCDFGIAKAAALGEQLTNPGQVKGKYAYMSPEQTVAAPLDGRSDVFSLAIVLWELLAGRTIVARADAVEAMRAIRDGKLPPIQQVVPKTPSALVKALNWALQTDREKRATPLQLANALEAYIKSSPDLATPLHLGMWIRARFPRQLEVGSELSARAGTPPERPSATQVHEGTVSGDLTPMPPIDGLAQPTDDLLVHDPRRSSSRETADLREHLRQLRGDSARPIDSLEQRPPLGLSDTPPGSRNSVGSFAQTSPHERHSDTAFDGAATVSVSDDAAPMFLRDGAVDPFPRDKETEVDEARPEVPWSRFEPEAAVHATHPQRNPTRAPSRAQSPSVAPSSRPGSSARAPSSPSAAPPIHPESPNRAPSSPAAAPPMHLELESPRRAPSAAPPNRPVSPTSPPRTSTLPPPLRANTPGGGARQLSLRPGIHPLAGSPNVSNPESVAMIPRTDLSRGVNDGRLPTPNPDAGMRVPTATDASGSRRGPTINPMPLPPRALDPNFDPQRPFYGDQSGELIVAPSRPMPTDLAPRAPTANPAPIPSAPGYAGAPGHGFYASARPSPDAMQPHDPNAQLQPSRRTVAIGGFIAMAVIAFAAALAVRSCHDHPEANDATTNGAASGSSAPGSGSAIKSRPTVEPITE